MGRAGVMLRPELREFWDASVYLHADPEESIDRARVRDLQVFGSVDLVEERYMPGHELYRADASPMDAADIVLGMNDPARPVVMRWRSRP